MTAIMTKPKRGRPPKNHDAGTDVKEILIRSGTEVFTETGYMTSDISGILAKAGVPKGSFYYYFGSKENFGLKVIRHYDDCFSHLLDKCLSDTTLPPPERLLTFCSITKSGMEKYHWQRGCLIGNLGQEVISLPAGYCELLNDIITGWQKKKWRIVCWKRRRKILFPEILTAGRWLLFSGQAGKGRSCAPN